MANLKKTIAFTLALAMASSLMGCSVKKGSSSHKIKCSPVLATTVHNSTFIEDKYNQTMEAINASIESTSERIMDPTYRESSHRVIANTLTHEVYLDTFNYDSEYAYVDAVYKIADYETVLQDPNNLTDIVTFTDAIKSSDTISIDVTYKLVNNSSGWEITNEDEIQTEVQKFSTTDIVFVPIRDSIDLSGKSYESVINYKEYFDYTLSSELGTSIVLNGDLNIHMYLDFTETTATITLDKDLLISDVKNYVINNRDAIVEASMGVSISTVKLLSGMSDDDINNEIINTVMVEINKINFNTFSMSGEYEVDGENIIIHGISSQGDINGKIIDDKIDIDITNNTSIDAYLEENQLSFEMR